MLGTFTPDSAQYVCGYTVKKMTSWDDPRLEGRHPEFSRKSLKPGLGAGVMIDLAARIARTPVLNDQEDVPTALRHGSKLLPLGRYLRAQLRKELGREYEAPPDQALQNLREMARQDPEARTPRKLAAQAMAAKVQSIEAAYKIFDAPKRKGNNKL